MSQYELKLIDRRPSARDGAIPMGLHKDLYIFDKELNQMTTRYCPHSLENFGEKISRE